MRSALVIGVSLFCFGASQATAETCTKLKDTRMLDFQGAPLRDVVEFFSFHTCKRFILSEEIGSRPIYLVSLASISVDEAYQAFEIALDSIGLALVPEGKFLTIVTAPGMGETTTNNTPQDPMKTVVFSPRYIDAEVTATNVKPFLTEEGQSIAYKPTNAFIVSDRDSSLQKIIKLFEILDGKVNTGQVKLTFQEEGMLSVYQLPAPEKNRPSRIELNGVDMELYIELIYIKEDVFQYEIKRVIRGKDGSTLKLSGVIKLPASGDVALLQSTRLSLQLRIVQQRRGHMRSTIIIGVSLFLLGATKAEAIDCTPFKETSLNFQGAPLREVLEFFSLVNCKRFITTREIDNDTPVYLSSTSVISMEDAYEAFTIELGSLGIALLPQGKFLKLVPYGTPGAEKYIFVIPMPKEKIKKDPFKTIVFSLRYSDPKKIAQTINDYLFEEGRKSAYPLQDAVAVVNFEEALQKATRLLEMVDVKPRATASQVKLTFLEGDKTSMYQLPAPEGGRPSWLELHSPGSDLFIELILLKEEGTLHYEVKRKKDNAEIKLSGITLLPASGEVNLVETDGLRLHLDLIP